MKVLDPGHKYQLDWLDGTPFIRPMDPDNVIRFVKRQGDNYPGNTSQYPGTNIQEVLRALIDRVQYLDRQRPHDTNENVLYHLRKAIFFLEFRAAELHNRNLVVQHDDYGVVYEGDYIEHAKTCPKCGHIGCSGTCH